MNVVRLLLACVPLALFITGGCATTGPAAPCAGACGGVCQVPDGTGTACDPATAAALSEALADERRAEAFYKGVVARHGSVMPFANIVHAEGRHAQALETLMTRHGVAIPRGAPTDVPAIPATLKECARAAADAERRNIAIYDRIIPATQEADIKAVFERLRQVSLDNHLRAFERFAG